MCSHSSMEWPCEVRRLTLHHRKHALEQEPKYCDVVRLGYVQPLLIEWLGERRFSPCIICAFALEISRLV